jgi:8-oxo-dGTP pyrophosphatase MutT (NUDIX family)
VSEIVITPVRDLDLVVEPWTWPFSRQRQADIAANFEARRERAGGGIWNGRVLLMHRCEFADDVLRGAYFETDFADFLAWRDWGCPETGVLNCFAMGAVRSQDGAYLLGVMGPHTANAGRVYFPGGTPDRNDVVAGRVDLAASLLREMHEETGLGPGDFVPAPAWDAVMSGSRIALIRVLEAAQEAAALRERIRAHLARETQPELADIRIVRAPADLDDASMPDFVTAFLRRMWR